MKKPNPFNIVIIILAIILVLAISVHFLGVEERTLTFSGPNIYRAVYLYEVMDGQGYLVNLEVDGNWVDTGGQFNGKGLVTEAEKGQFVMLYGGDEVSVGGPTSATEDISASQLILSPAHAAVVKVGIEPVSDNTFASLNTKLGTLATALVPSSNLYNIGIHGDIMLDVDASLTPTIVQGLDNILKPNNEITLYEHGLRFSFSNADLNDLSAVNTFLNSNGIEVTKVATSSIELAVRSNAAILDNRDSLMQKAEPFSFTIYLLRVINSPLK